MVSSDSARTASITAPRLDPRGDPPSPFQRRRGLAGAPQRACDQRQRPLRRQLAGHCLGLGPPDIIEPGIDVSAPICGSPAVTNEINPAHGILFITPRRDPDEASATSQSFTAGPGSRRRRELLFCPVLAARTE